MKLNVNSAMSDVKVRYMCMDVKYFYLKNKMDRAKFIIIQISMIPQEFMDKYILKEKAHNEYISAWVTK